MLNFKKYARSFTYLAVVPLLLLLILGCHDNGPVAVAQPVVNDPSLELVKMLGLSNQCNYRYFPDKTRPVSAQLNVFFNDKYCPTCIIELYKYIEVLKRDHEFDVNFYTDMSEQRLGGVDKVVKPLHIVKTDPLFSALQLPILFQTDRYGRIFNTQAIHSGYLSLNFDYLQNYLSAH